VLDHYCPKPNCNCKEVVLSFYLVDGLTIKGDPILGYKVKFETGRGTVEEKSPDISMRFAKELYGGLANLFGGEAISFFENRYRKIKEWGAAYYGDGAEVAQIEARAQKVGRNDPCPCGSGKKYKKCCGL